MNNGQSKIFKPHLDRKEFDLPKKCNCKTFTMRELDAKDEIEAASQASRKMTPAQRDDETIASTIERREAIRLAVVEVDGIPVNRETPFDEMDKWTQRTMRFLMAAFGDLNGVDMDEIKKFTAGARTPTRNDPAKAKEAPSVGSPGTGSESLGT